MAPLAPLARRIDNPAMPPELTLEFIEKLPKTDLHCHLDGSLRLDTVLDLAKKQQVELPTFDRAGSTWSTPASAAPPSRTTSRRSTSRSR